jgi:plasmid stabilization system protein ParE
MSSYVVSPEARSDLVAVWRYYALEAGDVELADRIQAELIEAFHKIARMPGLGHSRTDLRTSRSASGLSASI